MNDKKLWKIFSLFIRLRDSDEKGFCKCITCGAIRYYKNMDCGHGHSRSHMGTKYDETNNHAQCKHCNGPAKHGNPVEYKKAVEKKYGPGTWDGIAFRARIPAKFGQFEIDLLEKTYKEKVEQLKQQKTLRE